MIRRMTEKPSKCGEIEDSRHTYEWSKHGILVITTLFKQYCQTAKCMDNLVYYNKLN